MPVLSAACKLLGRRPEFGRVQLVKVFRVSPLSSESPPPSGQSGARGLRVKAAYERSSSDSTLCGP